MTQGQFLSGVCIQSFPSPRLVAQSALLFTYSWRENNWIHTFPKGISAMWNAISLVSDLRYSVKSKLCMLKFLKFHTIWASCKMADGERNKVLQCFAFFIPCITFDAKNFIIRLTEWIPKTLHSICLSKLVLLRKHLVHKKPRSSNRIKHYNIFTRAFLAYGPHHIFSELM